MKENTMMRLFHGSPDPDMVLSRDGASANGLVNFGAIFFSASWETARAYGDGYVYGAEVDPAVIWTGDGDAEDALTEQLRSEGVDVEDEALMEAFRSAVIDERCLSQDEAEAVGDALGCSSPDLEAGWECQRLRLQVARRLGYHGAAMDDECGSIAVLTEFLPERMTRFDTDPDDEEVED